MKKDIKCSAEGDPSRTIKTAGRIFQPLPLGNFIILPPQQVNPHPGKLPLILGPGRAFGSGEHETTASCLELLGQIPELEGKKVLDFGCGTGILTLAAARLGASPIMALDNDPEALETCKNNVLLNGVAEQVIYLEGDLGVLKEGGFDLILANIYDDIILKNSSALAELTKKGGYIILSGITYEGYSPVKSSFMRRGFTSLKDRMMEEYCTLWMKKN